MRAQWRGDVPAVAERIAHEAGTLAVVAVGGLAERRRARRDCSPERGVDIFTKT
jgi:hypothetical protein